MVVSVVVFISCLCFSTTVVGKKLQIQDEIELYQNEVNTWLSSVDSYLQTFNSMSAHLAWVLSTNPSKKASLQTTELGQVRNKWKNKVCESEIKSEWLTSEQKRKLYLLCRGPKYTQEMIGSYIKVMGKLARAYNSEICLSETDVEKLKQSNQNISNYPKPGDCIYGEPDLERMMMRDDFNAEQKHWAWKTWHDFVGPKIKELYPVAISMQNLAAQNNGYQNMGEVWREELEIPDLERVVFQLYDEIRPLYEMLHAAVRHKLFLKYGPKHVDPKGPIPIHLLGNMWGQDWSSLIDLFLPKQKTPDLNERLKSKNWNVEDMVLQAEDMYASFGLPRMTNKFWNLSVFEDKENVSVCHGTAANLYSRNDFRMLLCAKVDMQDFYVIHHEMGHIQYYMAYQDQPAIFQDGSNSAIHESIGDAVMHGVLTPQHLHRLGLLVDAELKNPIVEHYLLLLQVLQKIPEIPFSLLIDKYRWDIFKGKITPYQYNRKYWELNHILRGVVPPEPRYEFQFDAGAKFHISDNTPYIRYFLSSIMQIQLFKGMCENTFSSESSEEYKDSKIELQIPLHKCDIYGSKKSGKKLKEMMEKGAGIHWTEALKLVTNEDYITTKPLIDYYMPIYKWLQQYISSENIHVGW